MLKHINEDNKISLLLVFFSCAWDSEKGQLWKKMWEKSFCDMTDR